LAGQPQRITRFGEQAVVVVSELDWLGPRRNATTLGDLLVNFAEASEDEEDPIGASSIQADPTARRRFLGGEELPTGR